MSNLRGRVLRLERKARIRRRWAAVYAEIARREDVERRRLVIWRFKQEEAKHVA